MIRRTEREKRRRGAAFTPESLEDRVVLSASGAGPGAVQHYQAAVDRLNGRFESKVGQLSSLVARRTARLDSRYGAAVVDAAEKVDGGSVSAARTSLDRSTAEVARQDRAFVNTVDRKVRAFTAAFSRDFGEVTAMYGRRDPAIKAAQPAVETNFRDALASIGGTLEGEAQAARGALQGTMASVRAGAGLAGMSGAPAMSGAVAADQALAGASQAQQAADMSAVDAFWSKYYGGFNALAAELATLPTPSAAFGHGAAAAGGASIPRIVHAPGTVHRLTSGGQPSGTSLAGSTATSGGSTAGTTNGNGGTTGTGSSVIGTGGTPGTGSVGGTVTGTTGATTTGSIASGMTGTSAAGPTGTGTTTGLGSTGALGSGAFVGPVSTTSTGTGTFTGPVSTTGTGTGTATGGGTTTGTLTTGTTTGAGTTVGSIGTVSTGSGTFVGPISTTGIGTGTGLGNSTGFGPGTGLGNSTGTTGGTAGAAATGSSATGSSAISGSSIGGTGGGLSGGAT